MPVRTAITVTCVVAACWAASASALWAGPITPGSVPSPPVINYNPVQGMELKDNSLIGKSYVSQGLSGEIFKSMAATTLIDINGVTAFAPATTTGNGNSLNFHSFIGMQIVDPVTGLASSAKSITVEFVGIKPNSAYLYAMSPQGGILGATLADDGIGRHGGFLATLSLDNIGSFAMWSLSESLLQGKNYEPWGIAEITFGTNIERTPEPATLSLGIAGIVGAFGFAWKRRGATRR